MAVESKGVGDTIDLRAVWRLLVRRRVTVIVGFWSVFVLAGLYLTFATPTYMAEGSFYVGTSEGAPLDPPTLLMRRLEATYGEGHGRVDAWLAGITSDRRDQKLIQFKVKGTSPEAAQRMAEELLNDVMTAHDLEIKKENEALGNELRDLRDLEKEGRTALGRLKGRANSSSEAAATVMYSTVELGTIRARIGQLELLLRTRVVPTKVAHPIVVANGPVSPKTGLVLGLALMGGLFLGVIAGFVAEAVAAERKGA